MEELPGTSSKYRKTVGYLNCSKCHYLQFNNTVQLITFAPNIDLIHIMTYGYMRVSTEGQSFESQKVLLSEFHCDKIFYEKSSGVKPRKELNKLLGILKEGDSLVVTRLDRLGRTLKELLSIVEYLSRKGVHFISVIDKIDTSTSIGRLFFHINAAYAQFERERLVSRTKEGLAAARETGKKLGRRPGLTDSAKKKAEYAAALYKNTTHRISELCEIVEVSRVTLYKYLRIKGVID